MNRPPLAPRIRRLLGVTLASLICLPSLTSGQQNTTFSVTVGSAVLCLDDVEPGYFYNYMSKLGRVNRREQGAYWFKTGEQLYGAQLREVFVSDGSSAHSFVGVVASVPPPQLIEALAQAPSGGKFTQTDPKDKYSAYVSPEGAQIVFQGRNAKLFCRRDRVRRND